jgi:hypothetical protein
MGPIRRESRREAGKAGFQGGKERRLNVPALLAPVLLPYSASLRSSRGSSPTFQEVLKCVHPSISSLPCSQRVWPPSQVSSSPGPPQHSPLRRLCRHRPRFRLRRLCRCRGPRSGPPRFITIAIIGVIIGLFAAIITAVTTTAGTSRKTAAEDLFARQGLVYRSISCPSASTLNPRASMALRAAPPLSSAGLV